VDPAELQALKDENEKLKAEVEQLQKDKAELEQTVAAKQAAFDDQSKTVSISSFSLNDLVLTTRTCVSSRKRGYNSPGRKMQSRRITKSSETRCRPRMRRRTNSKPR
jgi:cell division septum initiation protein DivIVA